MSASFINNMELGMESLHKSGAFLTVKSEDKVNIMTISWGNIGFEWGKPIFTVLVRKSRYTHDFLEKSKEFTVSIPTDSSYKEALSFCGTNSGRDVDKITKCNIALLDSSSVATPVVKGCEVCYECKIVYSQDMDLSKLSPELVTYSSYNEGNEHTFYFGEIVKTYSTK